MTTPARCILPNSTYFVSVRCVARTMRLAPSPRVTHTILYCLAVTLQRHRLHIQLHEFLFMANHFHLLLSDRSTSIPNFMRDLDALLSRALNALRGISGSNFEKGYNLLHVLEPERTLEHAVYTLANPVAANLVARSCSWPGASSLRMRYGQPIQVPRPNFGLWNAPPSKHPSRSKLPDSVPLVIHRPHVQPQRSDDDLRNEILQRLRVREHRLAAERRRRGRRVVGTRALSRMHFLDLPPREPLFRRKPSFSGALGAARKAAATAVASFQRAYREASARFRAGERNVIFPAGTWLYRVRFGVRCLPCACGPP